MNVTWKWLTGSIVAVAAVALGVSVGILLSRTIGSDGRATQTVGTDRPATDTPRLSGQALGPIELGMSRRAALATGWLGDAQETCSDIIGGGAEPGEYSYELDGEQSPGSLSGQVEFFDDRVTMIQVNSEVELPNGVTFDTGWDNPTAERVHRTGLQLLLRGVLRFERPRRRCALQAATSSGCTSRTPRAAPSLAIPDVTVCD